MTFIFEPITVALPFAEFCLICLNKYSPVLATDPAIAKPKPSKICFFPSSITFFGIDIVFECTGKFNSKEQSSKHLTAGAKRVLVSAPCKNADQTVVYGINHKNISKKDKIISVASCTTNCLAPLAYVMDKNFTIQNGYMTTIHSYTTDQRLLDNSHKDLRRARSGPNNMVPTSTGAAKALELILPKLKNKIDGISIRVPTPNVSLVQLSFVAKKTINEKLINNALTKASNTYLKNILGVTDQLCAPYAISV